MKLETLQEARYAHGKTIERVLKYFVFTKMTYGPTGEEQPLYVIKNEFVAQLDSGQYINDIVLGETDDGGKFAYVNNSESYVLNWFLDNIEIFKKSKVL